MAVLPPINANTDVKIAMPWADFVIEKQRRKVRLMILERAIGIAMLSGGVY
jgi:hypothetical protein